MSSAALTRLSNLNTRFLSVISLFHFSEFSNSLEVLSRETWANQDAPLGCRCDLSANRRAQRGGIRIVGDSRQDARWRKLIG